MDREERTPVAISATGSANIFVVCDDGTVWVSSSGQGWTQQDNAIPGTKAAELESRQEGRQTPFGD